MNVPKALYPFEGRYLQLPGGVRCHYLDEGSGEPVVMVHGNPTWSFYYRNLVLALRDKFRVIVPDHIGCGLSDKPDDAHYDYTLNRRVEDLSVLLESLHLEDRLSFVVHDWGGMIGLTYAVRHPERIKRIVLFNTAAFHLPATKAFPWPLWLARTRFGAFCIQRFNAFSRIATRVACRRKSLSRDIRGAYCAPYDSWKNRLATLRFVQDIPLRPSDRAYDVVTEVQGKLGLFAHTPVLICWGMKDFVFDHHFLEAWQTILPHAEVHRFADCGHYVLEDAAEEIVPLVQQFFRTTPAAVNHPQG
jgi:pimeloyl-ACP methyl ester carboxylesterase